MASCSSRSFEDVGRVLVGAVEAVVGFGESFVVADHQGGTVVVVGLAGGLQRRVVLVI